MNIILGILIVLLIPLLLYLYRQNKRILHEMKQLIKVSEAALDISHRVVNTDESTDLYQYILESCLKLIPKAKFGSILMFNSGNLLIAKASVGFNHDEISKFKLRLEESFLYIATNGKPDRTVIINRLEDIVLEKNIVKSGDKGFALRSEVSAPLIINNELMGLLCIDGDEDGIFTENDIYILDYMSQQISNVINNQKLYGEIFYLSRYDSLTNLLNRNSFEIEANKLLSKNTTESNNMSFVLIDIDNLKRANDTYGHDYGDEIIRSFASVIKGFLGEKDLCGRYGGDEFAVIFHSNSADLATTLEEIREIFRMHRISDEKDYTPSFSYGIATFQEANHSLVELYKLADMRMYQSKNRIKEYI